MYNIFEIFADDTNVHYYEELVGNELSEGETIQFILNLITDSVEDYDYYETYLYDKNLLESLINKDIKLGDTRVKIVKIR